VIATFVESVRNRYFNGYPPVEYSWCAPCGPGTGFWKLRLGNRHIRSSPGTDAVRIQNILQGHNTFELMYVGAVHNRQ